MIPPPPFHAGFATILEFNLFFSEREFELLDFCVKSQNGKTPIKKGQDKNVSTTIYFLQYFIRG